jgi:hypothetical protein
MAIEEIYAEIKKLSPKLRKELYSRLNVEPKKTHALDELIGIADGPKDKGSHTYKEDLYGKSRPL